MKRKMHCIALSTICLLLPACSGAKDDSMALVLLLAFGSTVFDNQTFAATYGDPGCGETSVTSTSDHGYAVTAYTDIYGAGGRDHWVLKLDGAGAVEWQKAYYGDDTQWPGAIEQTRDGGYVVAGKSRVWGLYNTGSEDFWILKLDASGGIQWEKIYEGAASGPTADQQDCAYNIQQTSDGGYIVAGRTNTFTAGGCDFWILKLGPDGAVEWGKAYGSTGDEWAYSVQQTKDRGYIVAGRTGSFGAGNHDYWIMKLDGAGGIAWQKRYGGANEDVPHTVRQTPDGGYIVNGWTQSFGSGSYDIWLLKLDPDGAVEWQKAYGTAGEESVRKQAGRSMEIARDGGYIISGYTTIATAGACDFWVLKLKRDGSIDWQKAYGGANNDVAFSIRKSGTGYVVAGHCDGDLYKGRVMLVSIDKNGNIPGSAITIGATSAAATDTAVTGVDTSATVTDTIPTVTDSSASVVDTTVVPVYY